MARLLTTGYEIEQPGNSVVGPENPFGLATGGTATVPARFTTQKRTGAACLTCQSGGGNGTSFLNVFSAWVASRTYYMRAYLGPFPSLPTSDTKVVAVGVVGTSGLTVRLTTGGNLQLWNETAGTQIGSNSSATLVGQSPPVFYRVELKIVLNGSSQITDCELQLDGVTVATASGLTLTVGNWIMGFLTGPGVSKALLIDDVALNDSTGAANNTYPGSGEVVLLKPVADDATQGAGWTLGTGTALGGNGFTAVANTPPIGVADLAAGSDVKQIRNANAAVNHAYNADLTDYTTAGVGASATINALHPWTLTSAPVVTGAAAGTFGLLSNPAIALVALSAAGTAGAFWAGLAGGTYPQPPTAPGTCGWKWSPGTITEAPSVTLGTRPVASINKVTSTTRIAVCCFVGMYVDYTPAPSGLPQGPPLVALQAIQNSRRG